MARRFRSALHPVQRIKHIIDAEGNVDGTTLATVPIVVASDTPVIGSPTTVITGSSVHGIYLHVEVSHTSGVGRPNVYMIIFKNPGGNLANASFIPDNMGINDNKRYVIHQEMVLMSGDAGNGLPRPLFNGVIVIPKGLSRFGPGDTLNMNIITGTPAVNADWCIQSHYKEFR